MLGRNTVVRPAGVVRSTGQRPWTSSSQTIEVFGNYSDHTDGITPDPGSTIAAGGTHTAPTDPFDGQSFCLLEHPILPGSVDTICFQAGWDHRNDGSPDAPGISVGHYFLGIITDLTMPWNSWLTNYFGGDDLATGVKSIPKPVINPADPVFQFSTKCPKGKEIDGVRHFTIDATTINRPIIGFWGYCTGDGFGSAGFGNSWDQGGGGGAFVLSVRIFSSQLPTQFSVVARESFMYTSPTVMGPPFSVRKVYLAKDSETDPTMNSVHTFWKQYPLFTNLNCSDAFPGTDFLNPSYSFSLFGVGSGGLVSTSTPPDADHTDYYDSLTVTAAPFGTTSQLFEVYNERNCAGGSPTFNPAAFLGFNEAENSIFFVRGDGQDSYVEAKTPCSGVITWGWY